MKKLFSIIIAAIVIAGLTFCLWYTRPRTLDSILGLDEHEVTDLTASSMAVVYFNEGTADFSFDHETHTIDHADEEAIGEMLEIMRSTRYRCSLMSLLNWDHATYTDVSATVLVSMVLDNDTPCTAVYADKVHFGRLITSPLDETVSERMAEYIQTCGELR